MTCCDTSAILQVCGSKCNEDFLSSLCSQGACYYLDCEWPRRAVITTFILIPRDCFIAFTQDQRGQKKSLAYQQEDTLGDEQTMD